MQQSGGENLGHNLDDLTGAHVARIWDLDDDTGAVVRRQWFVGRVMGRTGGSGGQGIFFRVLYADGTEENIQGDMVRRCIDDYRRGTHTRQQTLDGRVVVPADDDGPPVEPRSPTPPLSSETAAAGRETARPSGRVGEVPAGPSDAERGEEPSQGCATAAPEPGTAAADDPPQQQLDASALADRGAGQQSKPPRALRPPIHHAVKSSRVPLLVANGAGTALQAEKRGREELDAGATSNGEPRKKRRGRQPAGEVIIVTDDPPHKNYKGVIYDDRKRNLAFQAKIHHNGAGLSLGHFDYADDAARAWDKAARKFGFDEFNFPEPGEKKAQRHDRRARGKKEEEVVAAAADDATAGGAAADGAAAGGAAADGAAAAGAAADGAATDGAAADGAATGAAAAAAGGERRGSSGAAGGE